MLLTLDLDKLKKVEVSTTLLRLTFLTPYASDEMLEKLSSRILPYENTVIMSEYILSNNWNTF